MTEIAATEELVLALKQVRQLLEKGWCRKVFAETESGASVDDTDPSACRWCLAGAVHRVGTERTVFRLLHQLNASLTHTMDELYPGGYGNHIPFFNDAQDSVEPVLELIDKTIERLEKEVSP